MIVDKLTISRFKSISHVEMDCKRVNVFLGEANAGKSNILESLALLARPYVGHHPEYSRLVRHNSLEDLFFLYDVAKPVEVDAGDWHFELSSSDGKFAFNCERSGSYIFKGEETGYSGSNEEKNTPFRPYRYEPITFTNPGKTDFLWPPDGSNLGYLVKTHTELREAARDLLEPFGLRLVVKPAQEHLEVLTELADKTPIIYPYKSLSDTLRRSIFFMAAILTNRDSVILLEEPEVHSFPYYIKYLAEQIALDERQNQYFLVTHNPYFLMTLLTKTPREEIQVFLTTSENNETRVQPMSSEEISEAVDSGHDLFFNLERFFP